MNDQAVEQLFEAAANVKKGTARDLTVGCIAMINYYTGPIAITEIRADEHGDLIFYDQNNESIAEHFDPTYGPVFFMTPAAVSFAFGRIDQPPLAFDLRSPLDIWQGNHHMDTPAICVQPGMIVWLRGRPTPARVMSTGIKTGLRPLVVIGTDGDSITLPYHAPVATIHDVAYEKWQPFCQTKGGDPSKLWEAAPGAVTMLINELRPGHIFMAAGRGIYRVEAINVTDSGDVEITDQRGETILYPSYSWVLVASFSKDAK